MEFKHVSILLEECIKYLEIKNDGVYIDGTLGGAGHAKEIYKRLSDKGLLIGLDQDIEALETSRERLESMSNKAKLVLINKNFQHIDEVCINNHVNGVDGILLDIGVSSYQLDEAERGFSYNKNAKLDMRMDKNGHLNAEKILNEYEEGEIARIIKDYGEEKWAKRIANFIVAKRKEKKIETTDELVDIIKAAVPSSARRDGPHPAKRTFQALRIAVNNELYVLEKAIERAVRVLNPGGRLCIITFHSLEDRIVKNAFIEKARGCVCPKEFPICVCNNKPLAKIVTKKPVLPSSEEVDKNPRSRSAKLRVLEKI